MINCEGEIESLDTMHKFSLVEENWTYYTENRQYRPLENEGNHPQDVTSFKSKLD